MKMNLIAAVALAIGAAVAPLTAQAQAYHATAEFDTASNPNGVWSYGYSLSGGAAYQFVAFDSSGINHWISSTYEDLGAPIIWINRGNTVAYGIEPGQMSMHPGIQDYSPAILRFTAPTAGEYMFEALFYPGDTGNMNAAVIINGVATSPYFSSPHTNHVGTTGHAYLAAGGTLDVAVGNNGDFGFGSTGVSVHVAAVPEPASAGMALAGLLVAGALAHRRRA
jgi:PEP-CTERM motif